MGQILSHNKILENQFASQASQISQLFTYRKLLENQITSQANASNFLELGKLPSQP